MRTAFVVAGIVSSVCVVVACKKERAPPPLSVDAEAPPSPSRSPADCTAKLDAIRKLRYGPQPCSDNAQCTAWNNGSYWDGCPNEMNVTNAKALDDLRKAYEGAGCTVVTTAKCGASQIRGCVEGFCGGRR